MQLVYEATGKPVQCGDVVHVGNWAHYVEQIVKPHKPGSTGRVYCISMDENKLFKEWFPSVIGAVWIGRTDQGKTTEHVDADGRHYIRYE